ncbi:hypothetical protein C8F01DRAFT_1368328 [Mycena amicta]|nr:hypothetical protein C8F01DRAFT_1368328 [Mycena amicta]
MDGIAHLTHDLPMFHDGTPIHTHANCNHCLVFQRDSGAKLSRCKACSSVLYCSKRCQVADWPSHKAECKHAQREIARVKEGSGIDSGYLDLLEWRRYYEAPLKNCLIAALQLRLRPHDERKYMLCVQLHHKGAEVTSGPGRLPVQQRFEIIAVGLNEPNDLPAWSCLRLFDSSHSSYQGACERGKIEQGSRFYGTGRFGLSAHFGPLERAVLVENIKMFAIDRDTAYATRTRDDWWTLFREYVSVGAKLRFCCGRVPGALGGCCCGGWVHDEEKKNAFKTVWP